MRKGLYTAFVFSLIFCAKCFSQAFPPVINTYADSVAFTYATLYISFSPNDTGVIKAQIQLQQGTGNNVYDSTYTIPAGDTSNVALQMTPLNACSDYDLLINMSNAHAQGSVINPLLSFTTKCYAAGIEPLNANDFAVIAYGQSVEVKTNERQPNSAIEIYDVTGKLVLNTHLNQSVQQIPFNKNAGIYLLRITGNDQLLYVTRFVIN